MATTITGSTSSSYWTFKIVVTENSTNATNNTSNVTVEAYIGRGSSAGASYMTGADISCTVSMTGCSNQTITYKNTNRVDVAQGAWLSIGKTTFASVPHDSDGSKTVTVSASFTNTISPPSGSASGNVTLTKITQAAQTYTIKYDANGGTGAPASQTKTHGVDMVMTTQIPSRTGYTFKCWNTAKDGTGYDRDPGGYVYGDADLTWYAQWTENIFTVNFYSNYADYGTYSGSSLNLSSSKNIVVHTQEFYYDDNYPTGLIDIQNADYLYLSRTGYNPTGYWGTSTSGGTLVNCSTSFSTGQAVAEAFGKSIKTGNASISVYAQWEKIEATTYTITFNANGGTTANPSTITVNAGQALGTLPTTSREGYTFDGWYTAVTGGTKITTTTTVTKDVTYWAHWTIITYGVTYDANGGTGAPSPQIKSYGNDLTLSSTIPIRDGYTFKGWGTSASDTTVDYAAGATYSKNADITLYAIWGKDTVTYSISYVLNGGTSGSNAPTSAEVGSWITVDNPTRGNATFNGWDITGMDTSTHSYGNSTFYGYNTSTATSLNGIKVTKFKNLRESAGTVTFTATWEVPTYTATFDSNGGTTANPSTITVEQGSALGTLPTTSRDGYTFNGWFTATSGGTQITTTTVPTSNVTYYAQWTVKTYTVSYNAKSGSGAPASQTKTHGVDLVLSSTVPTRTNYTFKGWSTSYWATTVNYSPGDTYTANASVTLYAVWEAKVSCTATFDANGGTTASPSTITVNSGDVLGTLPSTSRDGYTFDGWYTAASGGTKISETTTITSNVTYYAHWTVITYTVSYNANGGTGAPSAQTKTHGVDLTLSSTVPTRTNYTFKGWGTSVYDTSVDYAAGATYSTDASITLYAIWESYKTATFDANGGTTANPSTITVASGSALGTLPTTTRNGYTFDGWYTSKTGGIKISSATTITSNVTYYAQWIANTYTVSFNANGGSGAPSNQIKTHDINLTLSSTIPIRSGYTFKGWGTSSTDTTVDYVAGATYTANADITLYAIWTQLAAQNVYIYNNGKVYARAYVTATSIYIGSDGTFYAPAFTTGTSFSISESGVVAVQFIEGEP